MPLVRKTRLPSRRVVAGGAAAVAALVVGAVWAAPHVRSLFRDARAKARDRLDAASIFAAGGRWADAEREAAEAARLLPSDPAPLSLLGEMQLRAGKRSDAEATFRAVLARRPRDAAACAFFARAALAGGDADAALALIGDLRAAPGCPATIHEIAAAAELARGALDAALDARRAAADADRLRAQPSLEAADLAEYLARTTWSPERGALARELYAQSLQRARAQADAASPSEAARALLGLRRPKEALEALSGATAKDRREAAVLACLRAAGHAALGDFAAALRDVELPADAAPPPSLLAARLRVLAASGDRAGAVRELDAAGVAFRSPEVAAAAADLAATPERVECAGDLLAPALAPGAPVFAPDEGRFRAAAALGRDESGRFARFAWKLPRLLSSSATPERRDLDAEAAGLASDPANAARLRVVRAAEALACGRPQDVARLLGEFAPGSPGAAEAAFLRGLVADRDAPVEVRDDASAVQIAVRVRAAAEAGDVPRALEIADAGLVGHPNDPSITAARREAPEARGRSVDRRRDARALDDAERILASPADEASLRRAEELAASVATTPDTQARVALLTARLRLAHEDFADAIRRSDELVRANPKDGAARDVLRRAAQGEARRLSTAREAPSAERRLAATALAATGDMAGALAALGAADDADRETQTLRARFLLASGRTAESEAVLRPLVAAAPDDVAAALALARCEDEAGRAADAAARRRAVLARPEAAGVAVSTALSLVAGGAVASDDAALLEDAARRVEGGSRATLAALAVLVRGQAGDALAAARASGGGADAHVVAALAAARLGDAASSRDELLAACRESPGHGVARRLLPAADLRCGAAEYLSGELSRACVSLERAAVSGDPLDAPAALLLAHACAGVSELEGDRCAARLSTTARHACVGPLFRGASARLHGRAVQAAAALKQALDLDPLHPLLLAEAVQATIAAGDARGATGLCAARIARGADPSGFAPYLAGLAAEASDDGDAAVAAYRTALAAAPRSCVRVGALARALRAHGGADEARRVVAAAAAEGDAGDDLLPRLAQAACASDPDAALAAMARAILGHGAAGDAAFERGELRLEFGDLDGARACYEAAIAASPESMPAYVRLLHVLWRGRRLDEARPRLESAARARPDDPAPACLLAMLDEHAGDRAAAEAGYRRALVASARCVVAANNLACLLASDASRRSEADEFARKALAAAPWSPQVLDTFGWIQCLAGRPRVGLPHLRRAARMQPQSAEIRLHEAEALAAVGETRAARAAFEEVARIDPDFARAHDVPSRLR